MKVKHKLVLVGFWHQFSCNKSNGRHLQHLLAWQRCYEIHHTWSVAFIRKTCTKFFKSTCFNFTLLQHCLWYLHEKHIVQSDQLVLAHEVFTNKCALSCLTFFNNCRSRSHTGTCVSVL